ncbi:hypothetical protein Tco_0348233 [Tanacetum coccineum]
MLIRSAESYECYTVGASIALATSLSDEEEFSADSTDVVELWMKSRIWAHKGSWSSMALKGMVEFYNSFLTHHYTATSRVCGDHIFYDISLRALSIFSIHASDIEYRSSLFGTQ